MPYSLSRAYSNAVNDRYNIYGYCLQQVRQWWGIGPKYGSAISAWYGARYKHRNSSAPRGAAVFYSGGRYGHVAFSLGNGYVRSTDVAGRGRVGTVPINWFARNWGYNLLGWTEDLNGVKLPLGSTSTSSGTTLPKVDLSAAQGAARTNPPMSTNRVTYAQVIHIERALVKVGLNPGPVDGHYGTTCKSAYAAWQRRLGYSGSGADGIPGMTSLTALGRKTGLFTVVP